MASHRGRLSGRVPAAGLDCVRPTSPARRTFSMEKMDKQPTTKGPADRFTGDVYLEGVAIGQPPSRLRVSRVRFTPGARTAWHSHAVGQTLHVLEGQGLVQARGGEVVDLRPGDTVHTPP